ncbi:recombinase [Pacificitalea manganoxidans]|uniref:Recombinase n=1 Tax=Pacificitalea manganoxidans TaxID=1411902 RepID=A0A291LW21_9RHOB|nr:recombinase family protein [Pacificitalea manganoxidans]ATI40892.1 recombinase [Pacificitalea manganoxidans]MDR6308226.1 DNA invertase Pin-like site-specific DNA recombinase [Pacificitalea manganoxidans]
MKTILYARVSTKDQTAAHQLTQAENAGYLVDDVVTDQGVSGVTTRLAERPQGRRLFDMLRSGDTLLVRWVDRLGRDYEDVSDNIRAFMRRGVVVRTIINGMVFDGSTQDPMQRAVRDALIGFMAALSQAQAEATKEARRAGIAHAKAQDFAGTKFRGRKPSYTREQFDQVGVASEQGLGTSEISRLVGLSRQAVLRIQADPSGCEQTLQKWGL